MQELVLFIFSFFFVLVIYELFIVNKIKKNIRRASRKKDSVSYAVKNKDGVVVYLEKIPAEIKFLITRYKFELKKLDFYKLLHLCAAVSSFDIVLIVALALLFEKTLLQLLVVVVLVVPVILVSYHMIYLIYKKRGLI